MKLPTTSKGELVVRVAAMPADTNSNGDIFGGWLMSQMDIGGSILATNIANNRVVTVAANEITFLRPVAVGDLVTCYAQLIRTGNTSLEIAVEAWVNNLRSDDMFVSTKGKFTYVSIDESGKPKPIS